MLSWDWQGDGVQTCHGDCHGNRLDPFAGWAQYESDQGWRAGYPLGDVILGPFPFILLMMVAIVILCFFPQVATGLPNLVLGPGR